ncbi:MAG: SUMF1/EgtB/PvdO family nonheme iron enzyme [Deltaproteobacteria bacterium]|nr:SUMF1/EgtB/PvdO family nonheme iron enzyme [Deltaproteobacteria bacterium]
MRVLGQVRALKLGVAVLIAVAVTVDLDVKVVRAGAEAPAHSGKIDVVYRGHDMVKVPRGSFRIGSTAAQLERALDLCAREVGERFEELACQSQFFEDELTPPRPITLFGFLMDRFEVTVGEYRACVAAGGCAIDPLLVAAPEPAPAAAIRDALADDLPMVGVTWYEAAAYCKRAGKRLPTEAEWEYAARGATARTWPFGSRLYPTLMNHGQIAPESIAATQTLPLFAVDERDGQRYRAPVGSYPHGKSPFGVEDLAGNVAEWVSDWYAAGGYARIESLAPRGPASGVFKVLRGGSYLSPAYRTRSASREGLPPGERAAWLGFRCVRDLPP